MTLRTGGRILVDQLRIQGCDRVFTVPGRASSRCSTRECTDDRELFPKRWVYGMPTIGRLMGGASSLADDHRQAHVHVIGPDSEAVFILNCPHGPPELRESFGVRLANLNRVAEALADSLPNVAAGGVNSWRLRQELRRAESDGGLARGWLRARGRLYRRRSRVVVKLSTGVELAFPPNSPRV